MGNIRNTNQAPKIRPWIGPDGQNLSLEELKSISRQWDQSTWNTYLDSLEAPAKEKYLSPFLLMRKALKKNLNIFYFSQSSSDHETVMKVKTAMEFLTTRQRQVIEMTYWGNRSQREIAEILGLHRSRVMEIKQQALKKLGDLLSDTPGTLPIVEGQFSDEPKNDGNNDPGDDFSDSESISEAI